MPAPLTLPLSKRHDSRTRSIPVMVRRIVIALGLAILPLAAVAAPSAPPVTPGAPGASAAQARDGGSITGKITAIDYQRNILAVDAGARGRMDVSVMPSTSIQGKDPAYHAFSDLKAGQKVQIFSSIADGKYVAQIIRIR
jgi:hypothetical protein